jgi:hypothetical protein
LRSTCAGVLLVAAACCRKSVVTVKCTSSATFRPGRNRRLYRHNHTLGADDLTASVPCPTSSSVASFRHQTSMHESEEDDKGIHPVFKCGVSNQARMGDYPGAGRHHQGYGHQRSACYAQPPQIYGQRGLWMSPFAMASDVELMMVVSTGNGAPPAPPVS